MNSANTNMVYCNGLLPLPNCSQHLCRSFKVWRLALEKADKKPSLCMAQSCRWHICHLATWLLQPFVHHLNSLRPSIKFTMEVEKDGTLPIHSGGEREGWWIQTTLKVPLIMKLLILSLCLQTTYFMEVEKDGTLPFRMCLWLTSTKSHHTDHSVASYGKCTENQHVQTDVSTIDLTTSLPPRIESWSITYKPKWCNRSYVIYCIPCQDGNHLYVGETCRTLKTRALYVMSFIAISHSKELCGFTIYIKHSHSHFELLTFLWSIR